MPFATSPDGVRVHYDLEGAGAPLLLHHGFGSTPDRWRWEGFVDALKDSYRLILFAARGHGLSDKPHAAAAYAWERRVADVKAVLDDLSIDRVLFWGYSMGGRTGFAMLRYARERVQAAVIGGSDPYGRPASFYEGRIRLLKEGMDAYVANLERQTGAALPRERRAHYMSSDAEAWAALLRQYGAEDALDEGLSSIATPTLLYCGTRDEPHDGARRAASLMQNARFISLEGLTHRDAMERSDLVLPHVRPFLESVYTRV
jgi:pimeloyl-ACP methyl ester carboxylesterase